MEHDRPTASTVYKLYGSSQHCAFPGCMEPHIDIDQNTGTKICNTEVCHIRARRENGPRWDAFQSTEDNRSDSNLLLLCRKHHAVVDDRRNEEYYTPDMLKEWKAQQEKQPGRPLDKDDMEAISETNLLIAAETVNLGGHGGAAPGAGGGGGAAIGANAQGGRGGDGGRVFKDGRLADASALIPWSEILRAAPDGRAPGSGGGGTPVTGDEAVGGRGGDGGDAHIVSRLEMADMAALRIVCGRGARLPGEISGANYVERILPDGSSVAVTPKVLGGLSGDSYLPDEVPETDAAAIRRGVRVCCLTIVEGAAIENGTHKVGRFGLSAWDVHEFPAEIVFEVLTAVTKQPNETAGFFVSLVLEDEEKARIAVSIPGRDDGFLTTSRTFKIGAFFEYGGRCSLIAHASGISLCETAIEIRRA